MRRMTLPIVLIDLMPCALVPIVTLAVAWALYSTEELAKLLDEPFGRPGREPTPETVPVERYCSQIVRELQEQVSIARGLTRRVDDGEFAVTRSDLSVVPYGAAGVADEVVAAPPVAYDAAAEAADVEYEAEEEGEEEEQEE